MTKAKKPDPAKAAARGAVLQAAPHTGGPGGNDPETAWPFGFEMREDGLYRRPRDESKTPFRVCGPFEVVAESRPEGNDAWGLLLRWRDRDGMQHTWNMPRAMLSGEAADVRARLAACGLDVVQTDGTRAALVECLAGLRCLRRARTVPRIGWHFGTTENPGVAFVLPAKTCGVPPNAEVLQLDIDPPPTVFRARGTLAEWRGGVAGLAEGNSRLVFALSLAFAGCLLTPLREEGGGVHLRGDSSKGKTTALHLAASVWGAPIGHDPFVRQWRATANAQEATAAAHNDCLLPLDEIGQADPREIGEAAYMLANGQGKDRMRDRGGLRRTAMWRVLLLSTGEESLADLMARGGRAVKAGQEVRFLDVPADAGAGFGLFEDLHGSADGDSFARELRRVAQHQHGTAGPAFLDWFAPRLAADAAWPGEVLAPRLRRFVDAHCPAGADGQVTRAAGRFALAALAGELATQAGVTGWVPGAGEQAAATCFRAWLEARGGSGSREAQRIVAAVRHFISLHGAARFETIRQNADEEGYARAKAGDLAGDLAGDDRAEAPPDTRTIMRAGWKWTQPGADGEPRWTYGFLPDVFRKEVCEPLGANEREARQKLHAAGLLLTEQRGGATRLLVRRRIAGHGRAQLVAIAGTVLEGEERDQVDEPPPRMAAE